MHECIESLVNKCNFLSNNNNVLVFPKIWILVYLYGKINITIVRKQYMSYHRMTPCIKKVETACKQTNTLPTCLRMAGPMLIAVARYTRGEGSTIRGFPGESRSTVFTELPSESYGTSTLLHPWSMWNHIVVCPDCRFKTYPGELGGVCKQEKRYITYNNCTTYL